MRAFREGGLVGILLVIASLASARTEPDIPKDFYVPPVICRTCVLATHGLLSPADPRLDLSKGVATIEFWLRPAWDAGVSASTPPLYFVLGTQRFATGAPLPEPASSPAPPPQPSTRSHTDSDLTGEAPAEPSAPSKSDGSSRPAGPAAAQPQFSPRYAVLLDDQHMYLQIGRRLWRKTLTATTIEKIAGQERIHFTLTFNTAGVTAFADGKQCAQFLNVRLPGKGNESDLGAATGPDDGGVVLVGGIPKVPEAESVAIWEPAAAVSREGTYVETIQDFRARLEPLNADIGGVRIWSRAFPSGQIEGDFPPLAQRGEDDLWRNIEFPESSGTHDAASYNDLVLYSRFWQSAHPELHRLAIQYPVSGRWINAARPETRRWTSPPPGADDSYGNVEDYPVISVLPSASPTVFYVYQDANLQGLLVKGEDDSSWQYTEREDGAPMGCSVKLEASGKLTVRFESPRTTFGGNGDGTPTQMVTLMRPTMRWKRFPVKPDTGFYTQGFLEYYRTAFKAFDIRKMDPLAAYEPGGTGCDLEVFDEPSKLEYHVDMNAAGAIVPFGFRYVGIDTANANLSATLCTDASEVGSSLSWHVGAGADLDMATGINLHVKADFGMSQSRDSSSKTTDSVAITKAFNKDFLLAVDKASSRLHPDLVEWVLRLRAHFNPEHPENLADLEQACREFVEKYGTHYAMAVTFGGMMIHTKTITESDLKEVAETGIKFEAEAKAGISEKSSEGIPGIVNVDTSMSASVTVAGGMEQRYKAASEKLRNKTDGKTWTLPSGKSFVGGDTPSTHHYDHSVPLFFDLRPLSELLSPLYFDDPVIIHTVRDTLRRVTREELAKSAAKIPEGKSLPEWKGTTSAEIVRVRAKSFTCPRDFAGTVKVALLEHSPDGSFLGTGYLPPDPFGGYQAIEFQISAEEQTSSMKPPYRFNWDTRLINWKDPITREINSPWMTWKIVPDQDVYTEEFGTNIGQWHVDPARVGAHVVVETNANFTSEFAAEADAHAYLGHTLGSSEVTCLGSTPYDENWFARLICDDPHFLPPQVKTLLIQQGKSAEINKAALDKARENPQVAQWRVRLEVEREPMKAGVIQPSKTSQEALERYRDFATERARAEIPQRSKFAAALHEQKPAPGGAKPSGEVVPPVKRTISIDRSGMVTIRWLSIGALRPKIDHFEWSRSTKSGSDPAVTGQRLDPVPSPQQVLVDQAGPGVYEYTVHAVLAGAGGERVLIFTDEVDNTKPSRGGPAPEPGQRPEGEINEWNATIQAGDGKVVIKWPSAPTPTPPVTWTRAARTSGPGQISRGRLDPGADGKLPDLTDEPGRGTYLYLFRVRDEAGRKIVLRALIDTTGPALAPRPAPEHK